MAEENPTSPGPPRSNDEVALEMMKFIAVTTGYGKGSGGAGFTGKAVQDAGGVCRRSASVV